MNTGVDSGLDLNANGRIREPEDAWGYGKFPGQYGMAVLSRFALGPELPRTFQLFRWSAMPDARQPINAQGVSYYPDPVWKNLRLSSKSFWDVPTQTPFGTLHVLASHPTPPGFDGPEDRNGCRNHDEIRLLQAYIENQEYLIDDAGQSGGLKQPAMFVVLGDLNSDPRDGGSRQAAIRRLIKHPLVAQYAAPSSSGATVAAETQAGVNAKHLGDAKYDTADFSDRSVGNLRVDYVLPSHQFFVASTGVFWPKLELVPKAQHEAIRQVLQASDHHLVWVDIGMQASE